jgi:small subunit ribosomal protein S4
LKGDRCYTDKCGVQRRSYPPGQHGQGRKKVSEYGTQLREKMKTRRYYGVLESQFHKYFEMAAKQSGMTGENLLSILESRLDNAVYRLGFGMSRPESRQIVRHGHISVNGRRVDIPSYLVKEGDIIGLSDSGRAIEKLKDTAEGNASRPLPKWLDFDRNILQAKVIALPERGDIDFPVEEHLIVELYSK